MLNQKKKEKKIKAIKKHNSRVPKHKKNKDQD